MNVLILAGGFGTRIHHISDGKPKPLVEVAGKPILERQIEFLRLHGMRDIRLSLHHKADQIISFCENRWPGKFEYVIEPEPLGTGGGIRFATSDWKDTFLVLNSDNLCDINLHAFMASAAPTIAAAHQEDARPYGLLEIVEQKVRSFSEKPKDPGPGYVNAGWYVLNPRIFDTIAEKKFMMETDVFPQLALRGELGAYLHHGYWIDAGTEERLAKAHLDFAGR